MRACHSASTSTGTSRLPDRTNSAPQKSPVTERGSARPSWTCACRRPTRRSGGGRAPASPWASRRRVFREPAVSARRHEADARARGAAGDLASRVVRVARPGDAPERSGEAVAERGGEQGRREAAAGDGVGRAGADGGEKEEARRQRRGVQAQRGVHQRGAKGGVLAGPHVMSRKPVPYLLGTVPARSANRNLGKRFSPRNYCETHATFRIRLAGTTLVHVSV